MTDIIVLLVVAIVVCLASVVIINIVCSKSVFVEEDDFITKYLKNKKIFLAKSRNHMELDTYFVLIGVLMTVVGVICYIFLRNIFISLLAAGATFFIPDFVVSLKARKANEGFELKYSRSLSMLASSIRAGLSIQQAVSELCTSKFIDDDIKKMYVKMNSSLKMGRSIKDAFHDFAEEVQSEDAFDVASAISLQSEIGGNEAQVVESIAANISKRIQDRSEINTIMGDSAMLINVFTFAPIVFLALLYFMMPDTFAVYFESTLNTIILVALIVAMYAGVFIARKIRDKALDI